MCNEVQDTMPCPKCYGTGRLPLTPRRRKVQESHAWAEALDGRAVIVRHPCSKHVRLGVAFQSSQGGFGAVKVYIGRGLRPPMVPPHATRFPSSKVLELDAYPWAWHCDIDVLTGDRLWYDTWPWHSRANVVAVPILVAQVADMKMCVERSAHFPDTAHLLDPGGTEVWHELPSAHADFQIREGT